MLLHIVERRPVNVIILSLIGLILEKKYKETGIQLHYTNRIKTLTFRNQVCCFFGPEEMIRD